MVYNEIMLGSGRALPLPIADLDLDRCDNMNIE
jgi:hypothetical protein